MAQPLIDDYDRVWGQIVQMRRDLAGDPRAWRARARLREVERSIVDELNQLRLSTRQFAQDTVPVIYEAGGITGAVQAGGSSFALINTEGVARLSAELYDSLLEATKGVEKTTKRMVRAIARDAALRAKVGGGTALDAAAEMERILAANRIYAVRYADGSLHGMAEYSQMAIRTTTGYAYNNGLVDGAVQEGVGWFEVLDGPGCGWTFHNDTDTALGKIVTDAEARQWPLAHPNCRRAFGARPDITSARQAAGAGGHVTEAQTRAQVAADNARRELQQRRAARAARLQRRARSGHADPRGYRASR